MRVLCIYPGMDPRYNDNFQALRYLRDQGLELGLLTRSAPGLKSTTASPEFEVANGIPIHRHWRDVRELNLLDGPGYERALAIATEFKPDVIWCSFQGNLPLGIRLKERFRVPLVLLVESLYQREQLLGVRERWWRRPRMAVQARRYRARLATVAEAVITSDPGDRPWLNGDGRTQFVPWCHEIVDEGSRNGSRKPARATYVGSLFHFKNAQRLPSMADTLLRHTPTEEIVVVGHGPYGGAVQQLQRKFGRRLQYVESLERGDALALWRESFMAFTPARMGGWGMFGDCWSLRVPVLSLHNPYALEEGEDACLAHANGGVVGAAKRLFTDAAYYRRIQDGGARRYREQHTAEAVGRRYLEVLSKL